MNTPKKFNDALPTEEGLRIEQKLQISNHDCGQTCLDMLGYNGHEMFPNQEVSSSDLSSIPGVQEVTVPVGQEETLDYKYPHIWIFLGKDKVAGAQHWVIRHKDKIYCPTVGTVDAQKYKKQYVAFILQEFVVPFKGQSVPNNYYKQHQKKVPEDETKQIYRLLTGGPSKEDKITSEVNIGETYVFFDRKVRYTGNRTLSNGIKEFQVEYLDDPLKNWQKGKKGERKWHGDWQLSKISKPEK